MSASNAVKSAAFPLVISAPSGAGKSTVTRRLLLKDKSLRSSISCTTRQARTGERHGRDYFFLTQEEFKRKIHRNEFLEWAMVHGEYYGTPRQYLASQIDAGHVTILAIDVQGAGSIRRKMPETVTVFLMPPSWHTLEERLARRHQDASEVVSRRLAHAPMELSQAKFFDYLVVNDTLDKAVAQIQSIIAAEKLRTMRQDLSSLGIKELAAGRRGS